MQGGLNDFECQINIIFVNRTTLIVSNEPLIINIFMFKLVLE